MEHPVASYEMSCTTPSVHLDAQGDLVAATRVHMVNLGFEGFAQALAAGVSVVIQDDLLVQRFQIHAKNSRARRVPASSAATSSSSLYR